MSWLRIEGNTSWNVVEVTADNKIQCVLPNDSTQPNYTKIIGKDGSALKVIDTGYIATSLESLAMFDTVDGAALNINLWSTSTVGMTVTQANGFINVNATGSIVANDYAILKTINTFFLTSCIPLHIRMSAAGSLWNLPVGTVSEFMWGTCATNAAPTDGMGIRVSGGSMRMFMNNNGTEVTQELTGLPTANETWEWVVDMYANVMKVFFNGTLLGEMPVPVSFPTPTSNNRQPLIIRVYNTASAPSASCIMRLAQISVQQRNAQFNKPWSEKLTCMGRGSYQSPVTTFYGTANRTNSAAPASASLSNTTLSYATLGWGFLFTCVAGAETDYALFWYLVPTGFKLVVKGITIDAYVSTALGATPVNIEWWAGFNSSWTSLATAAPWAPRLMGMGNMTFPASSAIGTRGNDIDRDFEACVDSGRYMHIVMKLPSSPTTGAIRGNVTIQGYFE